MNIFRISTFQITILRKYLKITGQGEIAEENATSPDQIKPHFLLDCCENPRVVGFVFWSVTLIPHIPGNSPIKALLEAEAERYPHKIKTRVFFSLV